MRAENVTNKPFLTPKNTGYAAAGALALTSIRTISSKKPVTKSHKFLGGLTIALTLLHIGVVEYLHSKYKKM